MTIYRYKKLAVNIDRLRTLVPGNPALVMSSGNTYADIDVADEYLADLDDAMTSLGFERDPMFVFLISAQLVGAEKEITSTDWQTLGGVVANPAFFTANLSRCINRLLGEARVNDTNIELRLVEKETNTVLGVVTVNDNVNVWASWDGWATTPPTVQGVSFYIEGRQVSPGLLPTAFVRFVSVGLCEQLT